MMFQKAKYFKRLINGLDDDELVFGLYVDQRAVCDWLDSGDDADLADDPLFVEAMMLNFDCEDFSDRHHDLLTMAFTDTVREAKITKTPE